MGGDDSIMKKYMISMVNDENKIINTIESTSIDFIYKNLIEIYKLYNKYCNADDDNYLFLSILLVMRGNGVFINNTHKLDDEIMSFITCNHSKYNKNDDGNLKCRRIINSIKKFFPETIKIVENSKSMWDKIMHIIIKLLYKNELTYLLDLIIRIDNLLRDKNEVVLKEFDEIYKVIKECIEFININITDKVVYDFLLQQLNNIIIDMGCFPVNDIKGMNIYSYVGSVIKSNKHKKTIIFDETFNVLYNNNYDIDDHVLKNYFNSKSVMLIIYILVDQILNHESMYYEITKYITLLPRQIYEAIMRWIVFMEVIYNDNSKELYAPIFNDNSVKVIAVGESLSYSDDEIYKLITNNIVKNASHQENYEIKYNGNMDDFLIEYSYFYNSYINQYISRTINSNSYDSSRIHKVLEAEFNNGNIKSINICKDW